jgi:hypothetical protein
MIQSIEFLISDKALAMWSVLGPILQNAEGSNEISQDEFTVDSLREEVAAGQCGVFVYYEDEVPKLVLAMQFNMTSKRKHAEIVAMAGEGLMRFKAAYWQYVVDWLRANGIVRLDAYGNGRLAKIYREKFGFDKSCEYVRMTL